jgi:pSer/pThr/pTyr-binding forkhead associated (FHA) protein
MQLVLIKSPNGPDQEIFFLKPGNNTFGSAYQNDLQVSSPGILPHHLNIEYSTEALVVSVAQTETLFQYGGKACQRATIRPGESFRLHNIPFYCHAVADNERTRMALFPAAQRTGDASNVAAVTTQGDPQITGFLMQKPVSYPMVIGRNQNCDLILGHPQVSAHHARIERDRDGVCIIDLGSSNGTYVSDVLIRKAPLAPGDSIVIMPYNLIFTGDYLNIYTLQQESKLIGWQVSVSAGSSKILDRVTIACSSNELVGLIGPSGSGKTTLMKCLSGQTLPGGGRVQLNGLEVYSHFPVFRRHIGYVPQDDIIHRELTVYQTLMYAAKLRLPIDMSEKERKT